MFERYSEPARQVIFFARYEASQYGSAAIETEHLLLGLIRVDNLLLRRFIPDSRTVEGIREQINQQAAIRDKTPTSVDIPLSEECVRILGHTSEEGPIVGTGQLLLGILREQNSFAAKILAALGLKVDSVREEVSRIPAAPSALKMNLHSAGPQHQMPVPKTPLPAAGVVPDAETAKRVAEAVWKPHLPVMSVDNFVAQDATLTFGVWIVTGSHHSDDTRTALAAFIQKEDGKILRLHQEKLDS